MEKSHLVPENAPVHQDIGWNEPLFNKHVLGRHGESDVHHDHIPTSRGDVSSLGGGRATPITILPSPAYPAARPATTAL